MKRLAFCTLALALLQGHTTCYPHTHDPPPPPKYNVVLILTDDQRYDTLQYMPKTRALLGDQGTTFTNAFVNVAVCCPSRAGTYSGTWGHTNGVIFNADVSDPEGGDDWTQPSAAFGGTDPRENGGALAFRALEANGIAEQLRNANYKTALVGKWLNGMTEYYNRYTPPVPTGWVEFFAYLDDGGSGCFQESCTGSNYVNYDIYDSVDNRIIRYGETAADYSTDVLADRAEHFLSEATPPFFLTVAPYSPHFGNTPNGFYTVMPAPRHAGTSTIDWSWVSNQPSWNEADISDKPAWVQNAPASVFANVNANFPKFQNETWEALQSVDDLVERVVNALANRGFLGTTLIVFTSDNGYLWGEHRLGQKTPPYEESIKVPLVIRFDPGGVTGRVETRPVTNVDLAPTFREMAALSPDPNHDGLSLMPLITNTATSWREGVLVENWQPNPPGAFIPALFPIMPDHALIRTGRWVLVDYNDADAGIDELYDMVADPYQLVNRIADPAYTATVADLRAKLAVLVAQ